MSEYNVKTTVINIYQLAEAVSITDKETGEEISVQDLQGMIYQEVENLADLLGIDLDEE